MKKQYMLVRTLKLPNENRPAIILSMVGPRGGFNTYEFDLEEARLLLAQLEVSIAALVRDAA
jgi:hypothetical protein